MKDEPVKEKDHEIRERERPERNAATWNKDPTGHRMSLLSSKDNKYAWKSINDLDLSNSDSCTPSYRLLPKDVLSIVFFFFSFFF